MVESLIPAGLNRSTLNSFVPTFEANANEHLGRIDSLVDSLNTKLNTLAANSDGLAGSIASLKSNVTASIATMEVDLSSAIGSFEVATLKLQDEIASTFTKLNLGDTTAISSLESIKTNFPTFDMDKMFTQLQTGSFDIFKDIPSLEIISGKVVEKAGVIVASAADAVKIALPDDLPAVAHATIARSGIIKSADFTNIIADLKAKGIETTKSAAAMKEELINHADKFAERGHTVMRSMGFTFDEYGTPTPPSIISKEDADAIKTQIRNDLDHFKGWAESAYKKGTAAIEALHKDFEVGNPNENTYEYSTSKYDALLKKHLKK